MYKGTHTCTCTHTHVHTHAHMHAFSHAHTHLVHCCRAGAIRLSHFSYNRDLGLRPNDTTRYEKKHIPGCILWEPLLLGPPEPPGYYYTKISKLEPAEQRGGKKEG